jgi:putative DNA primase/helicase
VFAAAMSRLEAAGYSIVLHVHDEIVAEVPRGFGSMEEFLQIITVLPEWAGGLPIAAKVREGERFYKIAKPEPKFEEPEDKPGKAEFGPRGNDRDSDDHYSSGERPWGHDAAAYIYLDENGAPYLRVVRTTAKQFPQYHWEMNRWVLGKPAGPKIPYRLPELVGAAPETPVFICEGEKDTDNVAILGLIATTNPEGARKGAWSNDFNRWFAGKRTVYILEDNDDDGRRHASEVASALKDIVGEIRIVSFPELPPHGDVSDWLEMGGTKAQLLARAKAGRAPGGGYTAIRASAVPQRDIDWLWRGHLAAGLLEMLTGQPGAGKSQIQCQYVASVTTGRPWPDGTNGLAPRNVIMMTAEDCIAETLCPRLTAAGADLDRVTILKAIRKDNKDRMFLLAEDLEVLEQVIADTGDVGLVTVDPITAYMGGKLDSHCATDVRSQLGPIKDLAERIGVGFSAVTHPAKIAGPRALDHFMGSQAFIAVARLGHLCVDEMEQDANGHRQATGRGLFTNPKNNPLQKQTIAYRITGAAGGTDARSGLEIPTSRIAWEETINISADDALAATSAKKDHSGAVMFLMDMLSNGPVPKTLIDERAAARGFSEDQLKRAKTKMGVMAFKAQEFQGAWFWCLAEHHPKQEGAAPKGALRPSLIDYDRCAHLRVPMDMIFFQVEACPLHRSRPR